MIKVLRISLYLDPEADPDLYRVFERLHPRRRAERLRFLAEKGMSVGDYPVFLSPIGQPTDATSQIEIQRPAGRSSIRLWDESASVDHDLAELF